MIPKPCLGPNCPWNRMATKQGRCDGCRSRWNAARNRRPERSIYKGRWQAVSKAARANQPWCSVCMGTRDLTTDHTTGLVVCRVCHRSEKQGGVLRGRGGSSPNEVGQNKGRVTFGGSL